MDTLRLFLVTFNVATRPPGQDLNSLLDFPSHFNKSKPMPDFYVIGFQEIKSQPQNIVLDSLFTDPWTSAVNKILTNQGFVIVKTIRLQGLILSVYTQLKHILYLRDIEAQYTKTGLGGMWGNKGAVSIRFSIYGCSVCFVNCHLTAHEHLLNDRINDYNTIIRSHNYHVRETSNILFHDYVFWIGDLNFRTDYPTNSITSQQILESLARIEKDDYRTILQHDQLKAVMQTGEAFSEFKEEQIKFPPTYKFFTGTDEYDLKRKPSWTDRILYKVAANNYENVTLRADLISYTHLPQYIVSDHKPVVAQFNIKIKPLEDAPAARAARSVPATVGAKASRIQMTRASAPVLDGETERVDEIAEDAEKVFSHYTDKTVEFAPMKNRTWYIGDADFITTCTLSPDVEVYPDDWIGIYDADFQSLDDYIAYEYLAKVAVPNSSMVPGEYRVITLNFPLGSGIRTPGFYRFIYFSQANSDVRSVLGMSEPFEVSSKEEKQLKSTIRTDPCEEPSTSSGVRDTRTSADIFSDFAALDIVNLSRHFHNDLNID